MTIDSYALLDAAADAIDGTSAQTAGEFLEAWFAEVGLDRDRVLAFCKEKSLHTAGHWLPVLGRNGLTEGSLGGVIAVAMMEGFTLGGEFMRASIAAIGARQ